MRDGGDPLCPLRLASTRARFKAPCRVVSGSTQTKERKVSLSVPMLIEGDFAAADGVRPSDCDGRIFDVNLHPEGTGVVRSSEGASAATTN